MKKLLVPGMVIVLLVAGALIGWTFHNLTEGKGNISPVTAAPLTAPPAAEKKYGERLPSFADLAERLKPEVVNISTAQVIKPRQSLRTPNRRQGQDFFGGEDFFNRFFGTMPERELKRASLGSGFIWDKDGYIITNSHVVEGATEITVTLPNEEEYPAKLIGRDNKTDLALIKIDPPRSLPTVKVGDSDKLRIGDWVIAIGNPFNIGQTITAGIVSAKGRIIGAGPYDDFIQTDAAINPGNSGGPLFNLDGEVVGINTAIVAQGQGIGFAIPINLARHIIAQLKSSGQIKRGWLGVVIQKLTPEMLGPLGLKEKGGALIAQVIKNGPADKAGIKRGDVVVAFDGKPIANMNDLPIIVADTPIGKEVDIKVLRKSKEMVLKVQVGLMPEEKDETVARAQAKGQKNLLGLTVQSITPEIAKELNLDDTSGVVVVEVNPDSPAAEAGITRGDIIKEINQREIKSADDYYKIVSPLPAREKILLLLQREDRAVYIVINPK